MEIKQGLTFNDLVELSKKDTKYKQLYIGLATIDQNMQSFIRDVVEDAVPNDVYDYYVKTEIMNQCYSVYLFSKSKQVTIGVSWTMTDFLLMCSNKKLEGEINEKIRRILLKFNDKGLSTTKINWLI